MFYLERHETNRDTGQHEDVWITIDPERGLIEEKTSTSTNPLTLQDKMDMARTAGFHTVELRTMDGKEFDGGSEPYWLWVVATK